MVLAAAWPSRSQGPARKEGEAKPAAAGLQTRRELLLWKQKAGLELAMLEAQVEAKRAEIKRVEAEYRMREVASTLDLLIKLDRPITLTFPDETPLEDVLKFIKEATSAGPGDPGVPIYVDPIGLEESGKTLRSPVTLDLRNIPARTMLRLVLKQLGLAYQVKDGLVTITSEASLDEDEAAP